MVLVFDLDDTLYNESSYMQSGFLAVSNYLEANFGLNRTEAYKTMLTIEAEQGRGRVFDILLHKFNIFTLCNYSTAYSYRLT